MDRLDHIKHLDWSIKRWLEDPQPEAVEEARVAGVALIIPKSGIFETAIKVSAIPEDEEAEE